MNKFKLLDELVKAMGLTPQEVVKHWNDTGAIKSALFSRSQAKKCGKRSKRKAEPEPKPKIERLNIRFMTEKDILGTIRKIISEQTGVEEEDVLLDSRLISIGVDSLDFVEITMIAEKTFGITIPDEDVRGKSTVQDIVNYLVKRKASME